MEASNPALSASSLDDASAYAAEVARTAALRSYRVVDTAPEASFDRITSLAARLFDMPAAFMSLADRERLWFKSCFGMTLDPISREMAFCDHAVRHGEILVVPDAALDPRFANSSLVAEPPHVRFYAGAPLINREGVALGTLCVVDLKPREFDADSRQTLVDLAAIIVDKLELRISTLRLTEESSARRDAQKDLADSRLRFESAFQMSANGMALASPGGQWLQVNERMCEMLGYSESELLQLTFQDITFPDDLEGDLDLARQLLEGEIRNYTLEKRYIKADGKLLWVSISVGLVRDENGEPAYFVTQVQDVSERRAVEERLRLLESVAVNANDAVLITDAAADTADGPHIVYANETFLRMTGYALDEVIGQAPRMLQGPGTSASSKARIRGALLRSKPIVVEMLNYKKDGTPFWIELSITPIANEKGVHTHWVSIQRDITERKATLDALRDSERRYHGIAANVPGMVYRLTMTSDGEFSFSFISDGCREIFGLEPEPIMKDATVIMSYVHPEHAQDFYASILESAQSLEPWTWEGRISLPGGAESWVRGTSKPTRDEDDTVIWDGIIFDVTQRRMEEEQLQAARVEAEHARVEAERANLAKSDFLSRMSHELRTPLNAILGFGQLLEMSELNEEDAQSVEQITKAGRHLLGLINEVLDIARIESGKLAISSETVGAGEIALEVLDLVRPLAAARAITIDDSQARTCDLYITADRQRLKQILLNLASNAVKYNRAGGKITVSIQDVGESVRISVSDTGPGIAPENMDLLWMPFERLGAETTGVEGTGVGLAVSQGLAKAMFTSLRVTSELGRGSDFSIELPRATDPQLMPVPEEDVDFAEILTVSSTRFVLLYIEDNPSNLQLVQRILKRRPEIRLLSAMQGELGYELARMHCPDLILLDLHLPDVTGLELLNRLKNNAATASIPVIVLSADATPGQSRRALESGAREYLTKPLDVSEFSDTLDRILVQNTDENGKRLGS